ncbi:hypothetical protein EPA93_43305 [Ktedonosporobacter rubrisoli]|uniref:Uncharacterized protein n=1 Tax=Ktedonosporobacter rubrisoli TaxID=2509675 RepID=A0A4P6K2S8_KTERU|nr:hypothetical protein [Ktedonosporobacter rubrisoli]QBD82444.1 hypothetical protein EPA93_43305 [Ktedonosporobacter rubrisoli]
MGELNGNTELTERERFILKWIADQYCVRFDQLQRLLNQSVGETRTAIERLGLLESQEITYEHPRTFWLSQRALMLLGLSYEYYEPQPNSLERIYCANNVRINLETKKPNVKWFSERAIRHQLQSYNPSPSLLPVPVAKVQFNSRSATIDIILNFAPDVLTKLAPWYQHGEIWLYVYESFAEEIALVYLNLVEDLRKRVKIFSLIDFEELSL